MATVAEGAVDALTGALAEKKARIEAATSAGMKETRVLPHLIKTNEPV